MNPSMNADAVAGALGVGRKTVYRLAREGQLHSYRIGRKLLFSPEDVEAYLRSAGSPSSARNGIISEHDAIAIAGDDLAADVIADCAINAHISATRVRESSYCGLVKLYRGTIDAALLHLYDQKTGTYNIPYVQRLAPGLPAVVIRLLRRRVGLIVHAHDEQMPRTWPDLLRCEGAIATRPRGYATRVLLDEELLALEANLNQLSRRYVPCASEAEIAQNVAAGRACVGIASEDACDHATDVAFIPLGSEWVDIAIAKSERTRSFIRCVKEAAATSGAFRNRIAGTTAGNVDALGAIVYEC